MTTSGKQEPPTTDPPADGAICEIELNEHADEMWAESNLAEETPTHLALVTKSVWQMGWIAGYKASLRKML